MSRKTTHQANIEIRHTQNGAWVSETNLGFGLHGSGQGAGGRIQTREEYEKQERWAKEAKRNLLRKGELTR